MKKEILIEKVSKSGFGKKEVAVSLDDYFKENFTI
jgi:hypothetical protein